MKKHVVKGWVPFDREGKIFKEKGVPIFVYGLRREAKEDQKTFYDEEGAVRKVVITVEVVD